MHGNIFHNGGSVSAACGYRTIYVGYPDPIKWPGGSIKTCWGKPRNLKTLLNLGLAKQYNEDLYTLDGNFYAMRVSFFKYVYIE